MPPLTERLKKYQEEVDLWEKLGRPIRTKERISEIYNENCAKCDKLISNFGVTRCDECGCLVNTSMTLNKLLFANCSCPIGKWDAEIKIEDTKTEIKKEENKIEDLPKVDSQLPPQKQVVVRRCCGN